MTNETPYYRLSPIAFCSLLSSFKCLNFCFLLSLFSSVLQKFLAVKIIYGSNHFRWKGEHDNYLKISAKP